MKLQMNNLFLVLVLGSLIGALAMAADNNDDKCSKAAACRQGTECRIVRGEPMCQCKEGAVCTDEWKPVCGSDKRTYPNKCHLTSSACGDTKVVRVAHIGRCITPPAGRG